MMCVHGEKVITDMFRNQRVCIAVCLCTPLYASMSVSLSLSLPNLLLAHSHSLSPPAPPPWLFVWSSEYTEGMQGVNYSGCQSVQNKNPAQTAQLGRQNTQRLPPGAVLVRLSPPPG